MSGEEPPLRRMRWWDVERVVPLERELFGRSAWSAETFWSELAQGAGRWYVVADAGPGGALAGYAGLQVSGADADVQTLAVAPTHRGRGLGRRLLEALVEQARERGSASMMLEVRADNTAAIGLYHSAGFERIAVRRRYYQPDGVDAWIMRRRPLR